MKPTARMAWIGTVLCTTGLGCAHFLETQTVAKFAAALEKQDLKSLKSASTDDFRRRALRHDKALEDIDTLNLPDGDVSVTKVHDVKRDGNVVQKDVTVEVGKRKRKLLYTLQKDPKSGKWLVDDITVRQQHRGATVVKPVTEQMDLLITVREFVEAWDGGRREEILKVVTPKLADELKALPAPALAGLAKDLVGKRDKGRTLKPKAEIDKDNAIVTLPRAKGKLVLGFRKVAGRWRVADASVETAGSDKNVPSLLKKAVVIRTAHEFLTAYGQNDRRQLQAVCTPKFYRESLRYGDLRDMPLETHPGGRPDLDVTVDRTRAVYTVKQPTRWLRVALVLADKADRPESRTKFLVEDVAVYDLRNRRETRVSSFFTARVKAQLFAEALARRNLTMVEKLSTGDFRRRVWDNLDARLMRSLPLMGLDRAGLTISATDFRGSVTEVHGRQGNDDVTYVLHERNGVVTVNDVQLLEYGKPQSLKTTLEITLPIHKFAAAIARNDVRSLQRNSSAHFTRMVWKQTRSVPYAGRNAERYLLRPLAGITRNGQDVIVTLGDEKQGAKVLLTNENSRYLVHDVILTDARSSKPFHLKQELRAELARSGALLPDPGKIGRNNTLIPAGSKRPTDLLGFEQLRTGVQNAAANRPSEYADAGLSAGYSARRYDPRSDAPSQSGRRSRAIAVDPQGAAFRDSTASRRASRSDRQSRVSSNPVDELMENLPARRFGRR